VIETVKVVIAVLLAYLMIAGITGAFQAWVADKMGDSTARDYGMMSINPFVHVDPLSMLLLPISFLLLNVIIGLSKPIPIVWQHITMPWRRLKLAVLALSQPIIILFMIVILVALHLLFVVIVAKTGITELLYSYRYIFEAVVGFSIWFLPYQLLMALTQIFFHEQRNVRIAAHQTFILLFLPLLGALLLRNVSSALLLNFINLVTKMFAMVFGIL